MNRHAAMATAVLWLILRRLWHNGRLALATLLGFVMAVGVVAAVPVFSAGALQRVLEDELIRVAAPGRGPADITLRHAAEEQRPVAPEQFDRLSDFIGRSAPDLLGVGVRSYLRYGALDVTHFVPADPMQVNPQVERWLVLAFASDLDRHARLIDGRMYRPGVNPGGEIEAVVAEPVLDQYEFTVGSVFSVPVARGSGVSRVQVRVVGAFQMPTRDNALWPIAAGFDRSVLVDEETFRQHVLPLPGARVYRYLWHLHVDTRDIHLANADRFLNGLLEVEARAGQLVPDTILYHSPREPLARYAGKARVLRVLLLALSVPLLCLTGYYLLLTAQLTVDRQRSEIAWLRSRGAGMAQILGLYVLEGLLYGGAALLTGPWLGMMLARVMGVTAGFLQFAERRPLPIIMDGRVFTYGAGAVAFALAATLVPVVQAARESIVTYRMQAARQNRAPLWQRYFVDVLLLGTSLYGYYTQRQGFAARLSAAVPGGEPPEMLVDPLHFILPALAIGAAGLLMLRFLPYVNLMLDRLARRRGSVSLHLALVQVARSPGASAPVVLLLALTTGLGQYGAAAARTLEQNQADQAYYRVGADVVVHEAWDYLQATNTYFEPPSRAHRNLPGVTAAARVFVGQNLIAQAGGRDVGQGTLMAVDTQEFARVAWFRRDLYAPYHPFAYLNRLGQDEEAVLVNPQFLQRNRLKPGDRITLRDGNRETNLVIYGATPYWPALYPGRGSAGDFFVANLEYVQLTYGLLPYQVWLKLEPGVTDLGPITGKLEEQGVRVVELVDARHLLAAARRDPQRTGLYGILTIGFIVSAGLTVLGLLLYAVLSLRRRLVQLGVLRALGLSVPQLLAALALEQTLNIGAGVAAGTGLGLLAARLFIPFLQVGTGASDQVPPFRIVTDPSDGLRLYAVLGVMLVGGLMALAVAVHRLQIHQAVRLGEDG